MAMAEVSPDTIGVWKAHGIRTDMAIPLSKRPDPGLSRAHTRKGLLVPRGSGKTNVGQLQIGFRYGGFN